MLWVRGDVSPAVVNTRSEGPAPPGPQGPLLAWQPGEPYSIHCPAAGRGAIISNISLVSQKGSSPPISSVGRWLVRVV